MTGFDFWNSFFNEMLSGTFAAPPEKDEPLTATAVREAVRNLERAISNPDPVSVLGLKVVSSPHLPTMKTIQTKFPRCHKKKWRVVKKFRKKYTKEVEDRTIYFFNPAALGMIGESYIAVNPATFGVLKNIG